VSCHEKIAVTQKFADNLQKFLRKTEKVPYRSVSELQCQLQEMLPVVYTSQIKVIHAFGGTFPVNEKVIYSFLLLLCYR